MKEPLLETWFNSALSVSLGFRTIFLHLLQSSSFGRGEKNSMTIQTIMSIPVMMCTLTTKGSVLLNSRVAEQQKALILFALTGIITEANVVVLSISEGAWVNLLTPLKRIFLRWYRLEQSYSVARNWLIRGKSGWIKFSEVMESAICSDEKSTITEKKSKFLQTTKS